MNHNSRGRTPLVIFLVLAMLVIVSLLQAKVGPPSRKAEAQNAGGTGNTSAPATEKPKDTGTTASETRTTEASSTEDYSSATGILVDNVLYTENADGTRTAASGWLKVDGKWYYGDASGAIIKDQILSTDDKEYYLNADGVMVKNETIEYQGLYYTAAEDGTLSSAVGWQKIDGSWVYLKADGTVSTEDRSGSLPTIDKYLGCSHLMEWMMDHFNDYYFLTNFTPMTDYTNTPEMLLRPYGEYGDESSMNCTGFVAHLLQSAGGDISKVSAMGLNGKYANADNYLRLATRGYVQYYTFDSVDEMLQSGLARKGDILYLEPDWSRPNADCHIGVYWGDTGVEDEFWNQNWNIKNDVTTIVMDDPIEKIYLFPVNGY